MKNYLHTQRGTVILIAMALAAAVSLLCGLAFRASLIVAPILLLCGWLFHSLTIEVAEGELRWRFGPGWIHKQVSLDLILSAQVVQTNIIEGWGIHLSRFGWLYNVSGRNAVAVKMKNGQHFALGTDEPEKLLQALGNPSLEPKG